MLKSISLLSILSISLISLTSCPYDSEISLGNPNKSYIEPQILGKWIATKVDSYNDSIIIEIKDFNSKEYLIEYKAIEFDGDINQAPFRGYSVPVGNKRIMNLNRVGNLHENLYINYRLNGNELLIAYASDEFIDIGFTSQKELDKFFEKNITQKELFEYEITFNRLNED